jgi:hypothetical protein
MKEILGERCSIASDFVLVHLGAAAKAIRQASAARSSVGRARAWERVALQYRKAGRELAKAELAALARMREALAEERKGLRT